MSTTKRVYLVVHDPRLSGQLEALFQAENWEAVSAENARELDSLIDQERPNLVVLAVLLPDANGLEVCKRLKADRRSAGAQVVLVSSLKRSAKFSLEARTRFGADLYLEMPLDPGEMMQAIMGILGPSEDEEQRSPTAKPTPPPPPPKRAVPPPPPPPEPPRPKPVHREEPPRPQAPEPPPVERRSAKATPETPRRAVRARAGDIPDDGKLGPVLLPELLLSLYQRRATGTLTIRSWEEERNILLRDGRVIAIHTNFIRDDALGQILIARGMVERAKLERLLVQSQKERRKLGEVLVGEKLLTDSELKNVLRSQARRKMNSAFRWKEGAYEFRPGQLDETDTLPIEQDMLSILLAGVGVHYDLSKLEERVYQNKDALVVRGDIAGIGPTDLNITKNEWRLLNLVDGERTLGEIVAEADLSFARTFQVLYLFLLFGLIRFAEGDRFFRLDEAVVDRARREAVRTPSEAEEEAIEEEPEKKVADFGDLAETPLVQFLYMLYRRKATGQLKVSRGDIEETVFLANGMPVRIASNRIGPHALGNLLVGQGKISAADRDRALALSRETSRPLGETLLAEKLLSPHDLFQALLAQIENKLIALFTWREGTYAFHEGPWDQREAPPITVDLTRLILRGVRDTIQADRIEAELRKYRSFPLLRTRGEADLVTLFTDPRESALVAMIDGRRTLGEVLDRTLLEPTRALQMIYSLLQLGLIRFKEE